MNIINIIIEAFFVGIPIAVIGFIISLALMYISDSKFTLAKFTFWKILLFFNFLTGFFGHLTFQYLGFNSYYCKHGIACGKK